MLRFFGRQWRGEAPLWVSALVVSILLTWGLVISATSWLRGFTMEQTPYANIAAGAVVYTLITAVCIWQLVGTWRAAAKSRGPNRWWITRWSARLVALLGIGLAGLALSGMPAGMTRYYAEAHDTDPIGVQGHSLAVNGDEVIVSGHLTWGLYYEFVEALRDNDGLRTIVLNSPGGHYAVGRRMSAMIKARGLDTMTTEMCGSACTFAYLGGHRRLLREGARLGYHSPSGNTDFILEQVGTHMAGVLREADVPEDFIARVFATPADGAWFPTVDELRDANIVTDVVE
jgi:hypothetical protein